MNNVMKRFLSIWAMAVAMSAATVALAQEVPSNLRDIRTLDFVREVHNLSAFTFECKATFSDDTEASIGSIINQANEILVSDGNGCVQITSYTDTRPSRLKFSVSQVPTGMYRVVTILTGDGERHSIMQGTDELVPEKSSDSIIFPNPAFAKTFTVRGCAPELEWYMTLDNVIIEDSMQEGTGSELVFGPYWQKGDYTVYNRYLGFSTYSSYISWYGIFNDDSLEPINNLPEQINIPYGGGVFEYDIQTYVPLEASEYRYIAEQMNTLGIPDCWSPGSGMKVELDVLPAAGDRKTLHLTFRCAPNFTSTERRQNTMFCLAHGGNTVKIVQPGNPSGQLEKFTLTGEWVSGHDFTLMLSGSQPGVKYILSCNGRAVRSVEGTGEPVDWGTTSVQGTYMVHASYGQKSMDMDGVLEMKKGDYVYGNNYTVTKTMLSEDRTNTVSDVTYYDGLGYPVQIQQQNASGDGHALITPIVYDDFRRPDAESFLPYPSLRNTLEYAPESVEEDFGYHSDTFGEEGDWPFTERTFETYAGGRVMSVRKPGFAYWDMDKKMEYAYRLNSDADDVRRLGYVYASAGNPDSVKCSGFYPKGTLECTMTVNEDADTSYVFVNPFGRQVLSRRLNGGERYDTYFVYDLKDSLVCAVQPEGSLSMPNEFPFEGEFAALWCFTYRYDSFGNLIESHVPGGGHKRTFYDRRNRPVFYTDDRMMAEEIYRFTQYDQMDRVVMECLCTISRTHDEIRQLLESNVNPFRIFDSMSAHLHLTSYYGVFNASDTSAFRPDPYTGNAEALDIEHCMTLPASEELNLEPEISGNALPAPDGSESYVKRDWFYDSFGRTIQLAETFDDGSKSTYSYKYDFTGNVLVSSEKHELPDGDADELVLRYTYDKARRKTSCRRMLNGKEYPEISYTYDDMGRIGSVSVAGRINETYAYDLQGALSRLESSSFGEKAFLQILKYHDPSLQVSVPSYSGRISEIGYSDAMQDYQYMSYYYDHAGRLSDTQRTGDDGEPYGEYEERDMKYDANGNLLSMRRIMSWGDSTHLSFGYSGNRMDMVSAEDSLWRYSYDSDGDMVSDGHRDLELSYNFLNLPSRIRIKDSASLVYSYLSDGTMVSVKDSFSGNGLRFRGSFVYTVSPEGWESVESVSYGEGRFYACTRTPSADGAGSSPIDGRPDFIDTWSVRDYLGSVRMVIDISSPEVQSLSDAILHRSDYLPFGLPFSPAAYSSASAMQGGSDVADAPQGTASRMSGIPQSSLERWQYNGKPEQVSGLANTGLLDYGARFYDPYVARWTAVDPMAFDYPAFGPYVFCAGNPVNFIDPYGLAVWVIDASGFLYLIEDEDDEDSEDKVYYKDKYGNLSTGFITVGNRDMLQAFVKSSSVLSSFTTQSGVNDLFKLFLFAANNTDVEWVVHRNGDSYTLGTRHDSDNSGGWEDYGLDKPDASVHSHPGVQTSANKEIESMGYWPEGVAKGSDWYNVVNDVNANRKYTRLSYVYFPNSVNLYFIGYHEAKYIRKVNNYKSFYFGTLNNR